MTISISPRGPFSLDASIRFLEGFTPARHEAAGPGEPLRLAFPADDGRSTVGAAIHQTPSAEVLADLTGAEQAGAAEPAGAAEQAGAAGPGTGELTGTAAVRTQLARILSLDVDGTGFPETIDDPVARALVDRNPGLRPVCFGSPYEAAVWAVIGQRVRMAAAARTKTDIAQAYGRQVDVAGITMPAFPTPRRLFEIEHLPGLPDVKTQRLHAIAQAALAGDLDAARLRAMPPEEALAHLRSLPGIGPFFAELILIRGAGHPDMFPTQERRLHAAMAEAYGLDRPAPEALAEIAGRWSPYRSWVALHLRTNADRPRT